MVAATKDATVLPLLASASTASAKETQTFDAKINPLPEATKNVAADSDYDSNNLAERIEWTEEEKRTVRRFLRPVNKRGCKHESRNKTIQPRDESHRRRLARRKFYKSRRGRANYRRRGQTVEPFNEWFKSLFDLDDRMWHRGWKTIKRNCRRHCSLTSYSCHITTDAATKTPNPLAA